MSGTSEKTVVIVLGRHGVWIRVGAVEAAVSPRAGVKRARGAMRAI